MRGHTARAPVAPTIQATIWAWFSSVGTVSPTVRPRRMTTARSATAMTWSMLCEIEDDGHAVVLQVAHEVEHPRRLA